ncbi:hypothetical protein [Paraburkholderia sp. J94]|uniref:hypothetical protein n=1 Tax=Paraburkholderia sp. J94 TaxID=2805441 RepID=UPI002AB22414|nr:hypothetical protein [Paraburkholderia sp. J94]
MPRTSASVLMSSSSCRASTPGRYAKRAASAGAAAALLALSGCYYYAPYGYAPYSPYYYGAVPAAGTQQETSPYPTAQSPQATHAAQATYAAPPNPAPAAIPDAQYPGSLTATAPVWPVWPAYYPAYPAYPAYYPYPAWGWGAPAISFGFGYWGGGGGHWHR